MRGRNEPSRSPAPLIGSVLAARRSCLVFGRDISLQQGFVHCPLVMEEAGGTGFLSSLCPWPPSSTRGGMSHCEQSPSQIGGLRCLG